MPKKFNRYCIGDIDVPGVTTVLKCIDKPELLRWYRRVGFSKADEISKEAREYGDWVHTGVEEWIHGHTYDKKLKSIVDGFARWADENVDKFICTEEAVFSDTYFYAGSIDIAATLKSGVDSIIDIKTSKGVWEDYFLQILAYKQCNRTLNDLFNPQNTGQGIILHLADRERWEVHLVPNDEDGKLFNVFKAALVIYRWKNGITN